MTDFELRPITDEDIDDVVDLQNRSHSHDGIPYRLTADELVQELSPPDFDRAADTRLATLDDQPVGYVYLNYHPSDTRLERCFVIGAVDPDHRRRGIGGQLVDWANRRATELLRSSGRDLPRHIRYEAQESAVGARALFESRGLKPVRYSEEMLRPLTLAHRAESERMPELGSVSIRPWPVDRSDEIRTVKNTAFADHWGSNPTTPEAWSAWIGGAGTRLDLSFVALDTSAGTGDPGEPDNPDDAGDTHRIVGHCINARYPQDDAVTGRRDAWINSLGTLPEYRGRGIATALILHSLTAFRAEGCTHAMLGVDSDSPTGANRLYAALGFETVDRHVTYELEV